ncbi:hypothetical protein HK405_007759 [Cladochytrium tenue]|nr:hypothetical protein HK405_007759 [Cladochytrium tenue]
MKTDGTTGQKTVLIQPSVERTIRSTLGEARLPDASEQERTMTVSRGKHLPSLKIVGDSSLRRRMIVEETQEYFKRQIMRGFALTAANMLFFGAIFAYFEDWAFWEGLYFTFIALTTIGIGSITYLGSMISEMALNQWIVTVQHIERRVDRYEVKARLKKQHRRQPEGQQLHTSGPSRQRRPTVQVDLPFEAEPISPMSVAKKLEPATSGFEPDLDAVSSSRDAAGEPSPRTMTSPAAESDAPGVSSPAERQRRHSLQRRSISGVVQISPAQLGRSPSLIASLSRPRPHIPTPQQQAAGLPDSANVEAGGPLQSPVAASGGSHGLSQSQSSAGAALETGSVRSLSTSLSSSRSDRRTRPLSWQRLSNEQLAGLEGIEHPVDTRASRRMSQLSDGREPLPPLLWRMTGAGGLGGLGGVGSPPNPPTLLSPPFLGGAVRTDPIEMPLPPRDDFDGDTELAEAAGAQEPVLEDDDDLLSDDDGDDGYGSLAGPRASVSSVRVFSVRSHRPSFFARRSGTGVGLFAGGTPSVVSPTPTSHSERSPLIPPRGNV